MGYNVSVGCLDCKVQCSSLRGEEAKVIARFAALHQGHHKELSVDNGFAEKAWAEGPDRFPDVYDEVILPTNVR